MDAVWNWSGEPVDKYDEAIAYLTDHPQEIQKAWLERCLDENRKYYQHQSHCLFQRTTPDCGCLTQIRCGHRAPTTKLAEEIRADERIPLLDKNITVADLPVFAEWQRRLDRELNRA